MHLRQQRHRLLLHEVTQPRRSIREITGSAAIINQDLDSTTENITWPNKLSADTEGDIFLGGLHMIHERDHDKTCGPIMAQGGIQAMETMMFTIDHINQQTWWIPNVTLGKCMNPKYGSLATFRAQAQMCIVDTRLNVNWGKIELGLGIYLKFYYIQTLIKCQNQMDFDF